MSHTLFAILKTFCIDISSIESNKEGNSKCDSTQYSMHTVYGRYVDSQILGQTTQKRFDGLYICDNLVLNEEQKRREKKKTAVKHNLLFVKLKVWENVCEPHRSV